MNIKKIFRTAAAVLALIGGGVATWASQFPMLDASLRNLDMAAEQLHTIQKSQPSERFGGHAHRAMALIEQAQVELRMAQTY